MRQPRNGRGTNPEVTRMAIRTNRGISARAAAAAVVFAAASALAQQLSFPTGTERTIGVVQAPEVDSEQAREYAAQQKTRHEKEKELRKLRATYFRTRNPEIRQAGIAKLRQYNDPALFPSLLEIFERDENDVRQAIVDHLAELGTDEADATLAWTAVFDENREIRELATKALERRATQTGRNSSRVQSVVAVGLRSGRERVIASAAELANVLKMYEAIPALISAQLSGSSAGVNTGGGDTSIAWILVGKQMAFVSDLTPVVGDSAVAFDPTLDVVTEGVYVRVIDAVVITYRASVHQSLLGLASAGFGGRSLTHLGYDIPAWREWYAKEFLPYRASLESSGG